MGNELEEFKDILQSLNYKNEIVRRVEEEFINILDNPQALAEFIEGLKTEIRLSSDPQGAHSSFYYFYLALAFHILRERKPAKEALARAIHIFKIQEHSLNESLGERLFAIIHMQHEDNIRAERACETAMAIIARLLKEYRDEGHYKKTEEYGKHEATLRILLESIKMSSPLQADENRDDISASSVEGYLVLPWLPIYEFVQAGPNGPIWVQPPIDSNISIRTVEIDGKLFEVFSTNSSPKAQDNQITLVRGIEYGWAKVKGQSMNANRPTIQEGDFVLFKKPWHEDTDAIVIACRLFVETENEYLVKKYIAKDCLLVSETDDTSQDYAPIQLNDAYQILGTVIAVAKPKK